MSRNPILDKPDDEPFRSEAEVVAYMDALLAPTPPKPRAQRRPKDENDWCTCVPVCVPCNLYMKPDGGGTDCHCPKCGAHGHLGNNYTRDCKSSFHRPPFGPGAHENFLKPLPPK